MTRVWSPAFRRRLLIFCAAVVGPTLVVLFLGVASLRRHQDAIAALAANTRQLQANQIVAEVERRVTTEATAALTDPAFAELTKLLVATDRQVVDQGRQRSLAFKTKHPIVRDIFVLQRSGVVYPPIQPPLPASPASLFTHEPGGLAGRAGRAWIEAERHEDSGRYSAAATKYGDVLKAAASPAIRALAMAGLARALGASGDKTRAGATWARLNADFGDVYSPDHHPYSVVSSIALKEFAPTYDALVRGVADRLVAGRWSITPDQADVFLRMLGVNDSSGAYRDHQARMASVRRLGAFLPRTLLAQNELVDAATIPGTPRDILFFRRSITGESVGIVLQDARIRADLVSAVAAAAAPGLSVDFDAVESTTVPFRPGLPTWRVSLSGGPAAGGWRRRDVATFSAIIFIVLGMLVMGVVLLARDVARETDLNRMRADLVSGVSHELKTPLSVIRVYAETIQHASDATPAERESFSSGIVLETERLRRIVDDVVAFSRIQQGQRVYRLSESSIADVARRAAEQFERYTRLHGFTLHADIATDIPHAKIDSRAVEQAVLNLLDNAAKYSGDSKDIGLRVFTTETDTVVEVQDRGVGITAAERDRIFERFHRGHHTDRGGYGLGLYLVRHVMDAHGGRVEVSSELGVGSRFALRFPLATSGGSDAEAPAG